MSNFLIHFNDKHDPKTGRFTFASGAAIAKGVKSSTDAMNPALERLSKGKKRPRADLSKMSDKELSDILRREEMERRYDAYFNTPTERKGMQYVKDALAIAGGIAGIAVAGLTAASTINNISKNSQK